MPTPAPGPGPGPIPVPLNWVKITNVAPGECIPLEFSATVDYSDVNVNPAAVGLGCAGAAPPDQGVGLGSGTLTFLLTHGGAAAGHTLTAALKAAGGVAVVSDTVSPVGIGNPCPIVIGGTDGVWRGLPVLDPTQPLAGTFDAKRGDDIHLQIEQPGQTVKGAYQPALLVFAGAAEVTLEKGAKQGKWKHDPIKAAKRGYHLRVILTKDGEVKAIVRAIFK
jgi:hypothetical protein